MPPGWCNTTRVVLGYLMVSVGVCINSASKSKAIFDGVMDLGLGVEYVSNCLLFCKIKIWRHGLKVRYRHGDLLVFLFFLFFMAGLFNHAKKLDSYSSWFSW